MTSSAHSIPCASEIATRIGAGRMAAASTRASCSSTDLIATVSQRPGSLQATAKPGCQLAAVVGMVESEVDGSLEQPDRVTNIVPSTAMHHYMHRVALLDQQRDGVGELQFATGARLDAAQRVEDRPVEQVPAGRGVGGRGVLRFWLLDHAVHALDVFGGGVADVEHAVSRDLLARQVEDRK